MAQQVISRGIRVSVVAPGPTRTALQPPAGVGPRTLPGSGSSESPIGRAGQSAELAPAYVVLVCAESGFVAGGTLDVNESHADALSPRVGPSIGCGPCPRT